MKHVEPPENLPVVPEPPETDTQDETGIEVEPKEDVHFRDSASGDTLESSLAEPAALRRGPAPASRSLQPDHSDMTQRKERPIRAPDDLLSVDDVAERLVLSRAAVYRLVALRRLPFYRLPGGIRFKSADVDAFLESRRSEAKPSDRYGAQGQG